MMKSDYSKDLAKLLSANETIELEVNHYFSDGVCIREMIAPAGSLIVGAEHTTNHLTTLVKGIMQIRIGKETKLVKAPATFEALKGSRKVGLAYTECVVHNIFPTDSRDIDEIEDMFTTVKRDKYLLMLGRLGFKEEDVRKASEDKLTYAPKGYHSIRPSKIEGMGLFASYDIEEGTFIGNASEGDIRSELGRYVNHSDKPNLKIISYKDKVEVYATRLILKDEEFTMDYEINTKELLCQYQ